MKTHRIHLPFIAILLLLGINISHASETDIKIPMHTKGTVTYYVSGFINDAITSDFLVDTGSGYVTINNKTLEELNRNGGTKFVKKISAVMANGSETIVPVYQLASLRLSENCVIHNIEAAVMPGATPNILGLSALKKAAPFSMSMQPPTLTLSSCAAESS